MQPYEIVMSPAEVYVAFEGEVYPAVDAPVTGLIAVGQPGGNWFNLGTAGKRNQTIAGVKVQFKSTTKLHTTAGATGWVKAFRTAEDILVDCVIEDLTLEQFSKAMNLAGIREMAQASGVAGYRSMGLKQGMDVQTWGVLVRVPASPYGDGMASQFEFPKAIETGDADLLFDSEGNAAALHFIFNVLEDPNASSEYERLGRFIAQTSYALP